ncbi:glycosyltransferase family 4 protein [Salinimicrobium sediminilitoris]|uniref:glycosyltransferase family 4 protein n=1 Tax=Salinimicrobium sediminilitoris TaxID=2876715 RepID=UPI001E43B0E3|nr:glycosyltransferase [Salinimicrobium sediminilitoris]MCC8358541.1 glycosyltransferase [Salinimicrobium sediminilitoris]
MKFGIITYILHKRIKGEYYSYEPYIREMNIWLRFFPEFLLLAPNEDKNPDPLEIPYNCRPTKFYEIPEISLINLKEILGAILFLPFVIIMIIKIMSRADHIHLRCPGNIGLIGCFVQVFFPGKPKTAKYAGNWDPEARQPRSYRLQKWILSNTFLTRNMQVLVYGEWPRQSKNIIPFFTASFSEKEKVEVPKKTFSEPFTFLFVGNLVEGKRPLEAVKLVEAMNAEVVQNRAPKIRASLEIYGDGPERFKLETYVKENQLHQYIIFKGSRPLEELKDAYKKAHFVILPSKSEGWPKALAEAMFFGCIPIASPVSCVPWMLNYGSRGILLDEYKNLEPRAKNQDGRKEWSVVSGQWSGDLEKIRNLMTDPERMKRMSEEAKKWSQQYTLERFEGAIKELLNNKK